MVRFTLDPTKRPAMTARERARLDALTDDEITSAALADPDNPPLTEAELECLSAARLVSVDAPDKG